jgi:hypothetical protein
MSNSKLVKYTKISPNKTSPRNHKIDTITIHCVVGQLSVETLGSIFSKKSNKASCNYAIGKDGRIGMYVEEKDRSWCSSNAANDHRAITIECASDINHPYAINEKVYAALIELCTDICKRNGIKKLNYTGNKNGNLHLHRWYQATSCPGDYMVSKMPYIAEQVNKKLNAKKFSNSKKCKYVITANRLNMRKGASTKYDVICVLKKGDEVEGTGYYYPNHYQIKYDGKKGWVTKKYLKKI